MPIYINFPREESRRKLSHSANKLLNILELNDDSATGITGGFPEKARYRTPTKDTSIREEHEKSKIKSPFGSTKRGEFTTESAKKSKPSSPFKVTFK